MIIIGIDPSLRNTAVVAMDYKTMKVIDHGLFETEKSKTKSIRVCSDDIRRGRETYLNLHAFIDRHKTRWGCVVAAETPSGSQSSAGMKSYGISAMMIATIEGCVEVMPLEVKKAALGRKKVSKQEMIDWAVEKHPELPWMRNKSTGKPLAKCEHIADAIGVIYAAMQTDQFKAIIQFAR